MQLATLILSFAALGASTSSKPREHRACATSSPLDSHCGTKGYLKDPAIICDTNDSHLDDCRDSCLSRHRCRSFKFDPAKHHDQKCTLFSKSLKSTRIIENNRFNSTLWAKCCFNCRHKPTHRPHTSRLMTDSSQAPASSVSSVCSSKARSSHCGTSASSSSSSSASSIAAPTSTSSPASSSVTDSPPSSSGSSITSSTSTSSSVSPSVTDSASSSSTPSSSSSSTSSSTASTTSSSSTIPPDVYPASTCAAAASATPTYQSPFFFQKSPSPPPNTTCDWLGRISNGNGNLMGFRLTPPFDGYCAKACYETPGCASFSTDLATGQSCHLYNEPFVKFVPQNLNPTPSPGDAIPEARFQDRACYQCNSTGPTCPCTVPAPPQNRTSDDICGQYSFPYDYARLVALENYESYRDARLVRTEELCAAKCFSRAYCTAIGFLQDQYCMLFVGNYTYTSFGGYPENGGMGDIDIYTPGCFWCNNLAGQNYNAAEYCPVSIS